MSGLHGGTHYAAQTVVEEVFGEHRRLILRNVPFLSQKGFLRVLVHFSRENSTMVIVWKLLNMIPIAWISTMVGGYFSGTCMRWMLTVCRKGGSRIWVIVDKTNGKHGR